MPVRHLKLFVELTTLDMLTADDVASILERSIPKSHIMVYAVRRAEAQRGARHG